MNCNTYHLEWTDREVPVTYIKDKKPYAKICNIKL